MNPDVASLAIKQVEMTPYNVGEIWQPFLEQNRKVEEWFYSGSQGRYAKERLQRELGRTLVTMVLLR